MNRNSCNLLLSPLHCAFAMLQSFLHKELVCLLTLLYINTVYLFHLSPEFVFICLIIIILYDPRLPLQLCPSYTDL